MKYFKYPYRFNFDYKVYKQRVRLLNGRQKLNFYLRIIFWFFVGLLYFALMIGGGFLSKYVKMNSNISNGLNIFLQIVIGISVLIIPPPICFLLCILVSYIFPVMSLPDINKTVLYKLNKTLVKYYKINWEYIITKCYNSSENKLINHDLLFYFYKDKLRIVNNIYWNKYDLGCYEIEKKDIKIYYKTKEKLLITILEVNDFYLELGKRALPFVRKWINEDL